MPQNGMYLEDRRRGPRRNTCKANCLVSGLVPGTGLVNGAASHNGWPAAAARIAESRPAGILNGTTPQRTVNGHINHGHKCKSTKAALPSTLGKRGSKVSAVTDASAAGRVGSGDIPGGMSVSGATSLDTVALPSHSGQVAPERGRSDAAKHQRSRKKPRCKKRDTEVVDPESFTLHLMPPQEREDWENDIQDVTHTDWDKMCFGVRPYGPEDLLQFDLRDLTLKQRDTADPPLMASYRPAACHPRPVQWSCCNFPTEPGQFADADE